MQADSSAEGISLMDFKKFPQRKMLLRAPLCLSARVCVCEAQTGSGLELLGGAPQGGGVSGQVLHDFH